MDQEGAVPSRIVLSAAAGDVPAGPAGTMSISPLYSLQGYHSDGSEADLTFSMPVAILIGVNASSVPAGYLPMGVHLLTEDRWSRLPGAGGELSRWSAGGLVGRTGTLAVFAAPVADGAALQVTAMTVSPGVQSNGWPVTISTTVGRSVTVTADIANAGGFSGIFRIELTMDGEARDAVTVVAEPGETVTVTMSASDIEDGEHAVSVLDRTSRFRAGTTVDWALIIVMSDARAAAG